MYTQKVQHQAFSFSDRLWSFYTQKTKWMMMLYSSERLSLVWVNLWQKCEKPFYRYWDNTFWQFLRGNFCCVWATLNLSRFRRFLVMHLRNYLQLRLLILQNEPPVTVISSVTFTNYCKSSHPLLLFHPLRLFDSQELIETKNLKKLLF